MHSRVKGINEIQATRADLEKKENQTALNTSERKNDEVGIRVSTLRSNEICALFRCNKYDIPWFLVTAAWLAACGGGSASSSADTGNGGSGTIPPYSFTVVATATGNLHATQSATVTFTISN